MTKPLVMCDCDGILAQFTEHLLLKISQTFGVHYNVNDVQRFDFSNLPGWSKEFWAPAKEPGFARNIPVIDGAIEGFKRLSEVADVEIATSPMKENPTWAHERNEWLEKYFGVPAGNVHHISKKERLMGDALCLVDDSGENVAKWGRYGILWDRSYNRQFAAVWRVDNWTDVIERVRQLDNRS